VRRLLGKQLRQPGEPHDVTADARAAMDLALYEQQKGPTPPLPAPDLQVLSHYIASRLQIARSSADAPHSTGDSVALHMLIATSELRKWQSDTPFVPWTACNFVASGLCTSTCGVPVVWSQLVGRSSRSGSVQRAVASASTDCTSSYAQVAEDDLRRLLVHSLAPGMRDVDLIYLFPPGCPPILEIARDSPTARKAVVSFATRVEAANAFKLLGGQDGADSMGRQQKVVRVPEGQFAGAKVRVRVMDVAGGKRKEAAAADGSPRRKR